MNRFQQIAWEGYAAEQRGQDALADLLYATAVRCAACDPQCVTCGNDVRGTALQCAACQAVERAR